MHRLSKLCSAILVVVAAGGANPISELAAEDLSVLPAQLEGIPAKRMMSAYLKGKAYEAFARRRVAYAALKTKRDVEAYQRRLRRFFVERLGGFPERTPLNAKSVGSMAGDGFRVEKVVFESRPRHFVTALLFLPRARPPYPGVIVPCGHSANGKAAAAYQRLCMLMAQGGIAALCYDPIGQGERYQLLDAEGKPRFKSTTEHTLLGVGGILVGRNTASYRVWDGMRALDYLAAREDIDDKRLGCTGNSGGGTLTEYLMALDDRIACAAPSCCVTSFQRRLETIGPGDAEQNIFGQIAFGLDHADYTILRAPKPTLLLTATRDFVDIQGSWDIFREAKRIYARFGFSERVDLVEEDAGHGYSRAKREAAVRWMRRWLLRKDDAMTEGELTVHTAAQVRCSNSGQVQQTEGARSVMDFNAGLAAQWEKPRRELWNKEHRQQALAEVRRLAGIRPLSKLPNLKPVQRGTIQRDGYAIQKLDLRPEPGLHLPGLLFLPDKPSGERTLYLHGEGKHVDAAAGGNIEKLVRAGHVVLAVDLRGSGETGPSSNNQWGGDWDDIFLAYLLGKSYLGMRAEDTLMAARFLSQWGQPEKPAPVRLVALGAAGPPALHAAALETQMFAQHFEFHQSTESWLPVLRDPALRGQLVHTVHGALAAYDLKDLWRSLP